MKLALYGILAITALALPRSVKGITFWDGVTCNKTEGGCKIEDAIKVFTNILRFLFAIAIPITVAMIVFGGIQMMVSRGSADKMKQGKDTMLKAVAGLIIVLASYIIVKAVRALITGVGEA